MNKGKVARIVGGALWALLSAPIFLICVIFGIAAGGSPILMVGASFVFAPLAALLSIPLNLIVIGFLLYGFSGYAAKERYISLAQLFLPLYILFVALVTLLFFLFAY